MMWVKGITRAVLALILGVLSTVLAAESLEQDDVPRLQLASLIQDEQTPGRPYSRVREEPRVSSWALSIDNDILTPLQRDQDYTYGLNVNVSGLWARDFALSLDRPLGVLDRLLGLDAISGQGVHSHSVEAGLFGFTPEDIEVREANPDDRPYASLVYLSSAREMLDPERQVSWKTTLTLGVLGLDLVGDLQNSVHDGLAGSAAEGWHNQISDGGELTARYGVARQQYLGTWGRTEFKSTLQGSIGYLTEASWSLSVRSGQYHTLWSAFNPELASYGEKSSYTTNSRALNERYWWGGVSLKARAYNAFLQGQFRDSVVTYRHSEVRPVLVEAWLGYTFAFAEGYRVSYVLRGHTSELRQGAGDRSLLWGSVIIARTLP